MTITGRIAPGQTVSGSASVQAHITRVLNTDSQAADQLLIRIASVISGGRVRIDQEHYQHAIKYVDPEGFIKNLKLNGLLELGRTDDSAQCAHDFESHYERARMS